MRRIFFWQVGLFAFLLVSTLSLGISCLHVVTIYHSQYVRRLFFQSCIWQGYGVLCAHQEMARYICSSIQSILWFMWLIDRAFFVQTWCRYLPRGSVPSISYLHTLTSLEASSSSHELHHHPLYTPRYHYSAPHLTRRLAEAPSHYRSALAMSRYSPVAQQLLSHRTLLFGPGASSGSQGSNGASSSSAQPSAITSASASQANHLNYPPHANSMNNQPPQAPLTGNDDVPWISEARLRERAEILEGFGGYAITMDFNREGQRFRRLSANGDIQADSLLMEEDYEMFSRVELTRLVYEVYGIWPHHLRVYVVL
jgi:hypothetical protein